MYSVDSLVVVSCSFVLVVLFGLLADIRRRTYRLSRLEAKIDALMRNAGIVYEPWRDLPAGVRESLQQGDTIGAIRLYREAKQVGLKEAKDVVDEFQRRSNGFGMPFRTE